MTNPYEPPKVVQKPSPKEEDFFERMQKYQWRGFYAGLALCILSTVLLGINPNTALTNVLYLIGIFGIILLFISIGSILPLVIWGFVKGYRESRSR